MENLSCFYSDCDKKVEYICKCISPDILVCKDHLSLHMDSTIGPHHIQSIYIGVNQVTKEVILKYTIREKEKLEEQKKSILTNFSIGFINSKQNLKNTLENVTHEIARIDEILKTILETEKISCHGTNPLLGVLIMNPEEALERFKTNFPQLSESLENIEIMMNYDKNIENILNKIIEQKLETELDSKFVEISEKFKLIDEKFNTIVESKNNQNEFIENIVNRKLISISEIVEDHEKMISDLSNQNLIKLNNQKNDKAIESISTDITNIHKIIDEIRENTLSNGSKLLEQKNEINNLLEKINFQIKVNEDCQLQLQENKNFLCRRIDESTQNFSSVFKSNFNAKFEALKAEINSMLLISKNDWEKEHHDLQNFFNTAIQSSNSKFEALKAEINSLLLISKKDWEKEYDGLKIILESVIQSSKESWVFFDKETDRKLADTKIFLMKEIDSLQNNLKKELITNLRKIIKAKSRLFNNKLKNQTKIFENSINKINKIEEEFNLLRNDFASNFKKEDPQRQTIKDPSENTNFPYFEILADLNYKFDSFGKISSIFSELNRRMIMLTSYETSLNLILREYWMKTNQKSLTLSTYEELSSMRHEMYSLKENLMKELESNVLSLMMNEEFSALSAYNNDIKNSRMEYFSIFHKIQNRFNEEIDKVNARDKKFSFYNNSKIYLINSKTSNKTMLTIYNTENSFQEHITIEMPDLINTGSCIIQIPDFKLFIFGNIPASGITGIFDPESLSYIDLSPGTPCYSAGGIYYEDFVFIFGGYNDTGALSLAQKFDLAQNLWIPLNPIPAPAFLCSCLPFNGNIIICGNGIPNVYKYDINDNSYYIIQNFNLMQHCCKTLFSGKSRLYLISWGEGRIYGSEFDNENSWHLLGMTAIVQYRQEFRTYYEGAVYIGLAGDRNIYYKFSLSRKRFEKIIEIDCI